MSKDVKPYTLEELAAEFKEGCVCPNPEQHAALAAPNKPDPIYCVRVSDWTRLRATVEALDTALARVKELEEALREMTPAPGFPKCDSRCSSNSHSYDEDNRCDCGMDEIRHRAEAARAAPSTPKVKP